MRAIIISRPGGQYESMNTTNRYRRLWMIGALGLLVAGGCDPKESSLGDFPDEESSETNDMNEGSGSEDSGEVESNVVGEPCELSNLDIESVFLDAAFNEVCGEGNYCLYAPEEAAPFRDCTTDEQCGGDGEFHCDPEEGRCALDPAFIEERSMCTQSCETAADCVGVDGTECEGGFSCEPIASLGSLCCQPVCVCNDDLSFTAAEDLRRQCEDGSLADRPGCG
jgi:hypothetical protein